MKSSIRSTFLIIQTLVTLLLVFLVVQGVLLWRVCHQGAGATQGLEHEGIPSLRYVASLKQNLNLYRLHSYELMFVQEKERPAKASQADALHRQNVELLDKLKGLFPAGQGQQLVSAVDSKLGNYVSAMARLRAKMDKEFEDAMKILDKEIPTQVGQLDDAVTKLADYCDALATERIGQTVGSFANIKTTALGFGTASISFGALVVVLVALNSSRIRRRLAELVHELSQSSDQVNDSSRLVSSASQGLAKGASQQAASLEETSASLEEISSMTKRNTENALRGKTLGTEARESASTGLSRLGEMNATLGSIKTAVAEMESAVREIQTSSQEVAKIIKTIDEIAFQTNLLALNAAVEAARAGEAGMGFAVVADEVRALAQRSAQAARDTSEQIATAVKRSELGGASSKKVAQSLGEVAGTAGKLEQVFQGIAKQIKSLDDVTAEIASASQEQNHGIGEVNTAVGQMDKVTQSNAASAEENAGAAEQLTGQAITLQQIVTKLQLLVAGTATAAAPEELPEVPRRASHRPAGAPARNPKPTAAPAAAPVRNTDSRESAIPIPAPGPDRELASQFKEF